MYELLFTVILVFDGEIIILFNLALINSLHHKDELVIRDIVIVNEHFTNIIAELYLDYNAPIQVKTSSQCYDNMDTYYLSAVCLNTCMLFNVAYH